MCRARTLYLRFGRIALWGGLCFVNALSGSGCVDFSGCVWPLRQRAAGADRAYFGVLILKAPCKKGRLFCAWQNICLDNYEYFGKTGTIGEEVLERGLLENFIKGMPAAYLKL